MLNVINSNNNQQMLNTTIGPIENQERRTFALTAVIIKVLATLNSTDLATAKISSMHDRYIALLC